MGNNSELGFFQEMKLQRMEYDEVRDEIYGMLSKGSTRYDRFIEVCKNYKKYRDKDFPLGKMREIYRKLKTESTSFDLYEYMKVEYFNLFKTYYNKKDVSNKMGHFASVFKNAKDYYELLKVQNKYEEYIEKQKYYKKELNTRTLSKNFILILFNYIRLEDTYDDFKILQELFQSQFSLSYDISFGNFNDKKGEILILAIEKEKETIQKKKK